MRMDYDKYVSMCSCEMSPSEMIKSKINDREFVHHENFDDIDLMDCLELNFEYSTTKEEDRNIQDIGGDQTHKSTMIEPELALTSLVKVNHQACFSQKIQETDYHDGMNVNVSKTSKYFVTCEEFKNLNGTNEYSTTGNEVFLSNNNIEKASLNQNDNKIFDKNLQTKFLNENGDQINDSLIFINKLVFQDNNKTDKKGNINNNFKNKYKKDMTTEKIKIVKKIAKIKDKNVKGKIKKDYKRSLRTVVSLLLKWIRAKERKCLRNGRLRKNNATIAAIEENLQKKTMDYYRLQLNKAITLGEEEIPLNLYIDQSFGILSKLVNFHIMKKSDEEKRSLKSKYRSKEVLNKFNEFLERYKA